MLRPIDHYFLEKDEPIKGCLQFLREHILKQDIHITETWKYGMPVYCYKGKMLCYLWVHKKYHQPYIGFVEGKLIDHPDLLQEKRARMKILLVDATQDLQMDKIDGILNTVIALYK
jgi:hypothetical protein